MTSCFHSDIDSDCNLQGSQGRNILDYAEDEGNRRPWVKKR